LGSISLGNVASAANFASATTIVFHDSEPTGMDKFKGTVTTTGGPANCINNRKVKVFKGNVSSAVQVGPSDMTNSAGNWVVPKEDPNNPQISPSKGFFAKVLKKVLGNGDICDAAWSTTLPSTSMTDL
jgi:hypothetical protein